MSRARHNENADCLTCQLSVKSWLKIFLMLKQQLLPLVFRFEDGCVLSGIRSSDPVKHKTGWAAVFGSEAFDSHWRSCWHSKYRWNCLSDHRLVLWGSSWQSWGCTTQNSESYSHKPLRHYRTCLRTSPWVWGCPSQVWKAGNLGRHPGEEVFYQPLSWTRVGLYQMKLVSKKWGNLSMSSIPGTPSFLVGIKSWVVSPARAVIGAVQRGVVLKSSIHWIRKDTSPPLRKKHTSIVLQRIQSEWINTMWQQKTFVKYTTSFFCCKWEADKSYDRC